MNNKTILDVCCGTKSFYFNKNNSNVLFCDIRDEEHILCDNRKIKVKPDIQVDFRELPFEDEQFNMVVFDPPHMSKLGKSSWMAKKYGILRYNWKKDLMEGFNECFRVLKKGGTLIFKWNCYQIATSDVLDLTDCQPLLGHKSGKNSKTHWIVFVK